LSPIKELEDQLDKCQVIGQESDVDVTNTCKQIEKKIKETKENIYKNLTLGSAYNYRVPPKSSHTMEYVKALCGDSWLEFL
jgi:acetyl-CoA carboxylase carboxyl transferase subunit alpha